MQGANDEGHCLSSLFEVWQTHKGNEGQVMGTKKQNHMAERIVEMLIEMGYIVKIDIPLVRNGFYLQMQFTSKAQWIHMMAEVISMYQSEEIARLMEKHKEEFNPRGDK